MAVYDASDNPHVIALLTPQTTPLSLPLLSQPNARTRNPQWGYNDKGIAFWGQATDPARTVAQYLLWHGARVTNCTAQTITLNDIHLLQVIASRRSYAYDLSDEDCSEWQVVVDLRDQPRSRALFFINIYQKDDRDVLQILGWQTWDSLAENTANGTYPVERLLEPCTFPVERTGHG